MIKKILIANRGEIAVRIIKAAREMKIKTVAVYSTADKDSLHIRMADQAMCIGPASVKESYLNKFALITTALMTGADAIHPGYGFLSENEEFAEMVEKHGLTFIGPKPKDIKLMGDKIAAKETAKNAGLPITPDSNGEVSSIEQAQRIANKIGYPVIIKAAYGGGGRGIRKVMEEDQLTEAFLSARKEGELAFGNPAVYMEKYLEDPKHIEVQIFGDGKGTAVAVGDRDCSVQRRHQKVVEEALSPTLTERQRDSILSSAKRAVERMKYRGAGTFEFLFEKGKFYFMEMNTRLQVEHPVTEEVFGVDLVKEQIRIASGEPLSIRQRYLKPQGHSIECRINAEDPETFIPSPGKITKLVVPQIDGVRFDTFIYQGFSVPTSYDSMIGKLIVHGKDRLDTIEKMKLALSKLEIEGIKTNIPLHLKILNSKGFVEGNYSQNWLEKNIDSL
ncbi:MAG: acetyl-CoA carboxylase biotin carboxylase subunit [Rickettsiales bacterium]|jgi:acetyl-CoA carboxylase biotin carboxylase subunit|nr:acetyl-CoA carboxylase biotin carboxylase subunit [Rickettsiales bacterium]